MTIRPITKDDLPRLAEIEKACFSNPWDEGSFLFLLTEQVCAVCAEDSEGEVQAFGAMLCVLDEGQIINVAVHPDARRQGLATQILDALREQAQERNLAFLSLEVRAGNLPAQKLYEKHGFVRVGVRRNYYERPREDAILMECAFAAGSAGGSEG